MGTYLKAALVFAALACVLLGALLWGQCRSRKACPCEGPETVSDPKTGTPAICQQPELAHVVDELLARTGIDRDSAIRAASHGDATAAPRERENHLTAAPHAGREALKEHRAIPSHVVHDAVMAALRVTAPNDDYARAGVEHCAAGAESAFEATLLDQRERDRAEVLSKLIANAQDMLGESRFSEDIAWLSELIGDLAAQRDDAIEAMSHRTTVAIGEIGERQDRQLCDFFLQVANRIRTRGYLRALSSAAVAGSVESAIPFQLPDVLEALAAEAPDVALLTAEQIGLLAQATPKEAEERVEALVHGHRLRLQGRNV
jgi:hypothetical protein